MLQPFVIKFRRICNTLSCFNIISLKPLLILFSLAFFQCLALPANSYSADTTNYLLISGSYAGTELLARGTAVASSDNPGTLASGTIVTGPECKIGDKEWPHFHGSLFGATDTVPCGHGKVVKITSIFIGNGIDLLLKTAMILEIAYRVSTIPDALEIYVSIIELHQAIEKAKDAIPPNQNAIGLLKTAIALDEAAFRAAKNDKVSIAKDLLKAALELKSEAYESFIIALQ